MPASANALAALTFAAPSRVEAVQALMRDAVANLNAAQTGTLAAPNSQASTRHAAGAASISADMALAKRSAGILSAPGAAATLTDTLASGAPQGSTVSIGALGRALAATLPTTPSSRTNAPFALPEVDVPALDTARFASSLAQAVTQSGISYEAHLLEWVEGRRSVDQVRAEPRAQMTAPTAATLATTQAEPATALTMLPNALPLPLPPGAVAHMQPASANAAAPSASATAAFPMHALTDVAHAAESPAAAWTAAQQITAAQLRWIESGDLRFALQAWPGQVCELHLRPDDHFTAPAYGEAGAPQGDGTLVLTLPHLGRLEARLRTGGDNVQVVLRPESEAAAGHLSRATAALSHGLGLAGLNLLGMVVHAPRP